MFLLEDSGNIELMMSKFCMLAEVTLAVCLKTVRTGDEGVGLGPRHLSR